MNALDQLALDKYGKRYEELCPVRKKIIEQLLECEKKW